MAAKLQGEIVSVTDAGDLVTDISVDKLDGAPTDERVSIHCGGHVTSCIFPADHDEPEMTFVAVQGKSGCVELSLVGDNASQFLGIRPGAAVTIKW